MTEYSVGPGVQAAMEAVGDTPRSDEHYLILQEGQRISQTMGSLAVYYWYESENAVKTAPFRT